MDQISFCNTYKQNSGLMRYVKCKERIWKVYVANSKLLLCPLHAWYNRFLMWSGVQNRDQREDLVSSVMELRDLLTSWAAVSSLKWTLLHGVSYKRSAIGARSFVRMETLTAINPFFSLQTNTDISWKLSCSSGSFLFSCFIILVCSWVC
jgi:hypothetical protein